MRLNLSKWAPDTPLAEIGIIKSSSFDVTADHIINEYGYARLLSVDGGNDEKMVLHDLYLCDRVMAEQGIIIVDDYFSEGWPGVSCACARYFLDDGSRFRPFAISPNKVYLTSRDHLAFYRRELALYRKESPSNCSTESMFGYDVDICSPIEGAASKWKRFIKQVTHIGSVL